MYSKDSKLEQQAKTHAKSLGKDNCGVEAYKGKYRLNLSRAYSRMHYNGNPQKRIATGLSVLDANGKIDKANSDTVAAKVAQIHNDLANGYFDATLVKYGLVELEVVDGGKKPQMTLLELYDWYCESKKGILSETYLQIHLQSVYRKGIEQAINAVGEHNAVAIQQWLITNRCKKTAKATLFHIDKAYQLGMKHKGLTHNPFTGMADEINIKKENKLSDSNNDDDEISDKRAFTIDEMNAIIEAFETPNRKHLAPIIKFLFWTGCRTGEAIGLQWRDIKWDKEVITFKRTYNRKLKLFKPTKTGIIRWFPIPKNGGVWNLLKSIPEGNPNEVVFKAKQGGIIDAIALHNIWHGKQAHNIPGVINELIQQGKVKEYLKLYATRHTYTSIQINDFGTPREVVAQWCGHDEKSCWVISPKILETQS
jgi:integrase